MLLSADNLRYYLLQKKFGQYPVELLLPQSDFQGKKFLKKNFHPFSGLDGGSRQQTVKVGNIFIGA